MKKILRKIIYLSLILFLQNNIYSQCFTSVVAGQNHVIAKKANGSYWGWGSNYGGQIAQNVSVFSETSPIVLPSNNYQYMSAGFYGVNTFAIQNNGTLWATGANVDGALGIGNLVSPIYGFMQIGTANNWKSISSYFNFTIAMKTNNNIWGWGANDSNQMGNNTCCANQLSPVLISSATDWKSIGVSGVSSVFAIKNNGTLWCWGSNVAYLISANAGSPVPVQHNPDTDWDKMSVGTGHILILKNNGSLWSWGDGGAGECGDTLPAGYVRNEPRQIVSNISWQSIAAGSRTSFGIKTDGTLWAWGLNDIGQLGVGNFVDQRLPVQLGTAANWAMVSSGYNFTVALRSDGSLWTWGSNYFGQLGNGTSTDDPTPTNIPIAGCALANKVFEQDKKSFKLSPNPAHGSLNIQYNGIENVNKIIIYDLVGKQVYSTNALGNNNFATNFDISQLQSGYYIVALKNDDAFVSQQKLIIE